MIAVADDQMDKVFKALADPGRRLLLDRLRQDNGQTLGQLCEYLEMARQSVEPAPRGARVGQSHQHACGMGGSSCTT